MKRLILILLALPMMLSAQNVDKLKQLFSEGKLFEASKIVESASKEAYDDYGIQMICGDVFYELGKYEEALTYYKKAEKIEDDDVDVLLKVADALHHLDRKDESYEYYEEAVDEADDDDELAIKADLRFAEAYIREMNLPKATIYIDRAKDIDDENTNVYLTKGNMYFKKAVYELSKNEYLTALKLDPENIDARAKLATSYYWLANREKDEDLRSELYVQCVKEWNTVIEKDPNNIKALYEAGRILYLASRFSDAAPKLNRLVQLNPSNTLGRWFLAQSLSNLGRCDSAAQHLSWAAENIDSVKVKAKLLLAQCYFSNKDYVSSADTYKQIMADTTLSLKDRKMYGNAAFMAQDTNTMIEQYDQIIEEKPDAACGIMMVLGRLFYVKKDYPRAISYFQKLANTEFCQEDGNPMGLMLLGQSYTIMANKKEATEEEKTENLNNALKYLSLASEMDSTDLRVKVYLSDVKVAQGDTDGAEELLLNVIDASMADPEKNSSALAQALPKICSIYLKSKSWSKVIEYGKKWTELSSTNAYGPLYVAMGYHNQYVGDQSNTGLCEEAVNWYKKVLEINPGFSTAKKNIELLGC